MHAVIQTGGKQHKVSEGESIDVELLPLKEGDSIEFDKVLLIFDGNNSKIGSPYLENATVKGEIVSHDKGKKIKIFKMKRRKGYRRSMGHRQNFTKVLIKTIKSPV
ncbi:MAG: 50S ribosomal protein L21 [SAR86 cluster bacterium]|nr:50S ribosomal protein L21 [SAR86 cluster bacterium]